MCGGLVTLGSFLSCLVVCYAHVFSCISDVRQRMNSAEGFAL